MRNIAIIGAGQLGSRHLQSMAQHRDNISIYVVDPSEESLELSKTRFLEVDEFQNKSLFFLTSVKKLPPMLDFVVISTNSLQRLLVLKELLHTSQVRYLLMEKFLFPKVEEYDEAVMLVKDMDTKVFVNCTRRIWPDYRKLQQLFKYDTNIKLQVSGGNWNLASNAIHFLDLFFYLTGDETAKFDISDLDHELLENKRQGYINFSGHLKGYTVSGNQFSMISSKIGVGISKIIIESDQRLCEIKERLGEMQYNGEKKSFKLYPISELTNQVFEQLIETGTCNLVPFERSVQDHLLLLKAVNQFLGDREGVIT